MRFDVENEEPIMAGQPIAEVGLRHGDSRLFIANRGEIAVRILRAARELGITTIQAHSAADADSLAVRMADEVRQHRAAASGQVLPEYRRDPRGGEATGADAIHPGYGFLVGKRGLRRRRRSGGARSSSVRPARRSAPWATRPRLARGAAQAAGVPRRARSEGASRITREARRLAEAIGYPLMIKAAAGGGGRGIRIAETPRRRSKRRSIKPPPKRKAAFGDGGLYLEQFVPRARHVEVQVLGDGVTCDPFLRARMLAAAPPAKSLGGGARARA